MSLISLLTLLLPLACAAEENDVVPLPVVSDKSAVSAPSPAVKEGIEYHLSELQPVSVSHYPVGVTGIQRHYLHFRNGEGNHYLVYEEEGSAVPLKEVASLKRTMETWGAACTVDLDCYRKAFCTGKCGNMYYQLSNTAPRESESGRCRLVSFTCTNSREPAAAR